MEVDEALSDLLASDLLGAGALDSEDLLSPVFSPEAAPLSAPPLAAVDDCESVLAPSVFALSVLAAGAAPLLRKSVAYQPDPFS